MWLRGLGCFLYDTPEMVHVRNITKQRVCVSIWMEYPFISVIHFNFMKLTDVPLQSFVWLVFF